MSLFMTGSKAYQQKWRQGSVLVEVLVSVVIMSVSLTLIMESFVASLKATAFNKQYTQALGILENRLEVLTRNNHVDEPIDLKIPDQQGSEKYAVTGSFDPAVKGLPKDLGTLDLGVTWDFWGKKKEVSLTTFLFKPVDDNQP